MVKLSNSVISSVCALIIGVLLVVWPEAAMLYLIIVIGVLFLVPAVVSIYGYFAHRSGEVKQMFPIAALGSALFGLWLIIMPGFFVSILMYVLGACLVLAGIHLIVCLISARSNEVVSLAYFILPVVILLAGILVLLNPFASATIPFVILGISCIFYSLSDLINYLKFRRRNADIEEVTPIEEIPNEEEETPAAETEEITEVEVIAEVEEVSEEE